MSGYRLVLCSLFVAFALPKANLAARSFRVDMMPNGGVNLCSNCHERPGGGGPRTPFGEAVRALVTPGGREEFWSEALAMLDSDGDDIPNGDELQDPDGTWRPGDAAPGDAALVTNPGVPDVPPPADEQFVRADFTADGSLDISDPIATLNFLFAGGPPTSCEKAADANGDGVVDIADPVFALNFLFAGGTSPPGPHPDCGIEMPGQETALSCDSTSC